MLNAIGMLAALLTTISFFPQVVRALKTQSTNDLSLIMCSLFTCGVSMWLVYGIGTKQLPIILANVVTLIFAVLLLFAKIKYK